MSKLKGDKVMKAWKYACFYEHHERDQGILLYIVINKAGMEINRCYKDLVSKNVTF